MAYGQLGPPRDASAGADEFTAYPRGSSVRGNTTQLAANMTTSNEPGIYIRGEFGIRLEDDMHVTENGAELFTPQSPSLEAPFGKVA